MNKKPQGLEWKNVDDYCLEAKHELWTYRIAAAHTSHLPVIGTITYLLSKQMGEAKAHCIEMERTVPKSDRDAKLAALKRLKAKAYTDASCGNKIPSTDTPPSGRAIT